MTKRIILCLGMVFLGSILSIGQESDKKEINLPEPVTTGGKPLMEALNERKTSRDFSEKEFDLQQLSNLLWAAFGVNRAESGKRTAPSAMNKQEISVFVSLKEGSYLYNAVDNKLELVSEGDQRGKMGKQDFAAVAPVVLTFVADYSRMSSKSSDEDKRFYAGTDAGYISQNVYLFCSSENLATVVMGSIDRDQITKSLNLGKDQKVVLSQCVGYPAE